MLPFLFSFTIFFFNLYPPGMRSIGSEVFNPLLFLLTVVRDALYGGFEDVSWEMILLVLFGRFLDSFDY